MDSWGAYFGAPGEVVFAGPVGGTLHVTLRHADGLRTMHARKTGAMIRASAVAGAIMAGADEGLVATVDRYGAEIGLAFQIVDDILDVEGTAQHHPKGRPTRLYRLRIARALEAQPWSSPAATSSS